VLLSLQDENRLEYTAIHQAYEEGIENLLQQNLPKEFDMVAFMEALPAYLEGPGQDKEEMGQAVTLLSNVSDFRYFKDMMLYERQQHEERGAEYLDHAQSATPPQAGGLEANELVELCAKLSVAKKRAGQLGHSRQPENFRLARGAMARASARRARGLADQHEAR